MDILLTLRPKQWAKNLFVLAPLVFSEHADDPALLTRSSLAFVLFCLLSGCVYLLNDITDIESDRGHPIKKERPIPSGRLPLARARLTLAVLLLVAIGGSFALSVHLAAVGLAYFCLNVGYSMALKHIPYVDVGTIATGFILRLFAGAVVIDVPLSFWLGACTFLLATYLALGKRRHELLVVAAGAESTRPVLARYDVGRVAAAMGGLAVATMACYAAYVFLGETQATFAPERLQWTVPCVAVGLWRFHRLAGRSGDGESPTESMLTDPIFVANLVAWAAVVGGVIYGWAP